MINDVLSHWFQVLLDSNHSNELVSTAPVEDMVSGSLEHGFKDLDFLLLVTELLSQHSFPRQDAQKIFEWYEPSLKFKNDFDSVGLSSKDKEVLFWFEYLSGLDRLGGQTLTSYEFQQLNTLYVKLRPALLDLRPIQEGIFSLVIDSEFVLPSLKKILAQADVNDLTHPITQLCVSFLEKAPNFNRLSCHVFSSQSAMLIEGGIDDRIINLFGRDQIDIQGLIKETQKYWAQDFEQEERPLNNVYRVDLTCYQGDQLTAEEWNVPLDQTTTSDRFPAFSYVPSVYQKKNNPTSNIGGGSGQGLQIYNGVLGPTNTILHGGNEFTATSFGQPLWNSSNMLGRFLK